MIDSLVAEENSK